MVIDRSKPDRRYRLPRCVWSLSAFVVITTLIIVSLFEMSFLIVMRQEQGVRGYHVRIECSAEL